MSKKKLTERQIPICPQCGSSSIRSRIRTRDFRCNRCGWDGRKTEWKPQTQIRSDVK